jgi:hypothetical protein
MDDKVITEAIERYKDFLRVNRGRPDQEKDIAINAWAEGAGLTPKQFELLQQQFEDLVISPGLELGWAIIGFILGLYAAEGEL